MDLRLVKSLMTDKNSGDDGDQSDVDGQGSSCYGNDRPKLKRKQVSKKSSDDAFSSSSGSDSNNASIVSTAKKLIKRRPEMRNTLKPPTPAERRAFGVRCDRSPPSKQPKFSVLAKIVRHMRHTYLNGSNEQLTLDQILDEIYMLDVDLSVKQWLSQHALPNNPKLFTFTDTNPPTYKFKPVYHLKDGRSMMRLLKYYDLKGLGGILLEDLEESLSKTDKVLKKYVDDIILHTRRSDRKQVLYYHDKSMDVDIDDDVKKLWHGVSLTTMVDQKIEEQLRKIGMPTMLVEEPIPKQVVKPKRSKGRPVRKLRDNEHVADILQHYDKF